MKKILFLFGIAVRVFSMNDVSVDYRVAEKIRHCRSEYRNCDSERKAVSEKMNRYHKKFRTAEEKRIFDNYNFKISSIILWELAIQSANIDYKKSLETKDEKFEQMADLKFEIAQELKLGIKNFDEENLDDFLGFRNLNELFQKYYKIITRRD